MNKQDHHKRYSDYKLTPLLGFGHQLLVSETLNIIFSHLLVNYLFLLFSKIFNKFIWTLKLKMKKVMYSSLGTTFNLKVLVLLPNYRLYFPMRKTKVTISSFLKKCLVVFSDHLFYLPFARFTLCYYDGYAIYICKINVKYAFYDTPVTTKFILNRYILLYYACYKLMFYYNCFESKHIV